MGTDTEIRELTPHTLKSRLAAAREIMLLLRTEIPDLLQESFLEGASAVPYRDLLVEDCAAVSTLRAFLRRGWQVLSCLGAPEQSLLFLDRREGYRLPDFAPLRDSFDLACKLRWRCNGAGCEVTGRVVETAEDRGLFSLSLGFGSVLWVNAQRCPRSFPRRPGNLVTVFGFQSWVISMLYALTITPAEEAAHPEK